MSSSQYNNFHKNFQEIVNSYSENAGKLWVETKIACNLYLESGDSRGLKDIEEAIKDAKTRDARDLKAALSGACQTIRAMAWGDVHHTQKNGQDVYWLPADKAAEPIKNALDHLGLDVWKEAREGFKHIFQIKVIVKRGEKSPDQRLKELAALAGKILISMDKDATENFIKMVKKEAGIREETAKANMAVAKLAEAKAAAKKAA